MTRPAAGASAPRPSRADELLEAIERAIARAQGSKTLRQAFPSAYAELVRHHEAARLIVIASTRPVVVRGLPTRRPFDSDVAYGALDALAELYGVP